uniref:Checkpoint with forkhead and ring finger domains, E3 ubiquitin protein ligase n=1 Tax=Takifugu rubripes TaxID=31033 RepID=A0A674MDZ9_TAKRU
MEGFRKERPWGKLVKVDSSETILLFNRECTVGRKLGDVGVLYVESHGISLIFLCFSTNGTVINMSKLVKKQTHMLQNGDVIYFVYRKSEPEQKDTQRSDCCLASVSPSEMLLSVEPVMLTKAPSDLSQDDPQPSTSSSCFCIGIQTVHDPGAPGSFYLPHMSTTEEVGPVKTGVNNVTKAPVDRPKTDKMEESLTCVICQDLLYDCVSLQPCMHVFCAACYSGWMERSPLCPTCRCPVERIRKNHILNNLVEAYLIQHPEKCRSEEDLKSMDSRNKITQDMLQPKVERSFSDEEGSSDYLLEFSDNDSDSSDMSQPIMCRQCPGYKADVTPAPVPPPPKPAATEGCAKAAGEQPSTSSDGPSAPQEYRCPPRGIHLICTCCLQPMPDRRAELGSQQVAQQCVLCQRSFCHMYWGCQRIGCQGCLAPFSELNLTDKCLDGALNSNAYESDVLQNYLSSRGKSWKDLRQEALQNVEQGKYPADCRISGSTIMCSDCGLRALRDLAYKYRQDIPSSELPAAVTARPDCYWGRNCRTQVKAHHAMKFNHICEQTRFKS